MNHDALFKMLLKSRSILCGFFQAFVPQAAQFIDFGTIETIDKERITLHGTRRTGDLLVKTRFRGKPAGFLIHLEHQAQPHPDLGRRMLEYFVLDWREYNLPVYPIAVLSHKTALGCRWKPVTLDFPNKRVLQFDFDVIDLAQLEAEIYVKMPNPAALALAARMKFDAKKRARLTRDFFINLAGAKSDRQAKNLAAGFFSAYHPMSHRQALQLQREIYKVESPGLRKRVMNLTNPFIELGKQQGRQEGRHQGEAELVLKQLVRRLGPLSEAQARLIRKLDLRKIEALGVALLEFHCSDDLGLWLRQITSKARRTRRISKN